MNVYEAFFIQTLWFLIAIVVGKAMYHIKKEAIPDCMYETGWWIMILFINFVFGTWFRWYTQMPMLGMYSWIL